MKTKKNLFRSVSRNGKLEWFYYGEHCTVQFDDGKVCGVGNSKQDGSPLRVRT